MALILHAGAEPVDFQTLRNLPVPAATSTHVPVPHHRLVEMMKHSLTFHDHEVTEEHYGITKDGHRFFGVLVLKSTYGDYTDICGLRNSHDKSLPIGVAYGSRVFVCDNLAFHAEHVLKRKHTAKALRDLHGLLAELVEPLTEGRKAQHLTLERYKATALTDMMADHVIMQLHRDHVLNVQRIPEVLHAWEKPEHDFGDKSAWRMFNAVTGVLAGRITENPGVTRTLHRVIDSVCQRVH